MRYSRDHNEATRKRILEVASFRFRKDGIHAVGLAPLMKEAGLTHGTFYTHFESKDDLIVSTLTELNRDRLHIISDILSQNDGLETFLRLFLSEAHRDAFTTGCLNASIVGEIARESAMVRMVYTEGLSETVDILAPHMTKFGSDRQRHAATALLAMVCGAIQSARAVSDAVSSKEILDSIFSMAMLFATGVNAER